MQCALGNAAAVVLALTLCASGSAMAQPQQPESNTSATDAAGHSETIPAEALADQRLTVAVHIGNAGPYPFIVDTAAERSVISREIAHELALPSAGRSRMLSMTSTREIEQVHMRDVSLTAGATRDLQPFSLRGEHIGAAGVLGIDALRGQRLILDFSANTMQIVPSRRNAQAEENAIVVRARQRYGQLVLAESRIDGVDIDVIIDSGLQISVGNEALRRLLSGRTGRFQPITLYGITGETQEADYAVVDTFNIGGIRIEGMPVAFANAHVFRRLRLTRRPALFLGMDTLRLFERVAVDFPNRRAYFVMEESG